MLRKCISVFFILYSIGLQAHDLGVWGRAYPISEVDIKKAIAKEANHTNWQKAGDELKASTKKYFNNLPNLGLTTVNQNSTYYVDPSVAFNRDFRAPNGQYFYHKGTYINPLTRVRPVTNMLFFDGTDPEQVKFVLGAIKRDPLKIMPVMTNGKPLELAKKIGRPVYYANKRMIARFHITHIPSLMGVGLGQNYFHLAITNFSEPYHVGLVEKCWHGCTPQDFKSFLNQS